MDSSPRGGVSGLIVQNGDAKKSLVEIQASIVQIQQRLDALTKLTQAKAVSSFLTLIGVFFTLLGK